MVLGNFRGRALRIAFGITVLALLLAGGADAAGDVYSWGNNWEGQLGDGTTTQRLTHVQVSGLISDGTPVSGARVTLTGEPLSTAVEPWAPLYNTTDANGQVILSVPSAGAGTIIATASKTGYTDGSTNITATTITGVSTGSVIRTVQSAQKEK